MPEIKGYTRLHNEDLKAETLGSGGVSVIDLTFDELVSAGMLDSDDIPSAKILHVIEGILGELGVTWAGDPQFWDPLDRELGGAVFIQNPWQEKV